MSEQPLRLEWLRSFAAVADSATYEAAADRLGSAQPTVWKHVRSLSRALGIELFHPGTARLTAEGAELVPQVRAVLRQENETRKLAEDLKAGVHGTVRVACYPAHVRYCLAEAAGRFKRKYPNARIELAPTDSGELLRFAPVDRLLAGEVDLAVGPRREDLDGFRLYRTRLVVVVPDAHAWRHREFVTGADLDGVDLLLSPAGHYSRDVVTSVCRESGFEPRVITESSDWDTLLALCRHGIGVAVVHSDALDVPPTAVDHPALIDGTGDAIEREAWLQWRRNEVLPPATNNFVSMFTEA